MNNKTYKGNREQICFLLLLLLCMEAASDVADFGAWALRPEIFHHVHHISYNVPGLRGLKTVNAVSCCNPGAQAM